MDEKMYKYLLYPNAMVRFNDQDVPVIDYIWLHREILSNTDNKIVLRSIDSITVDAHNKVATMIEDIWHCGPVKVEFYINERMLYVSSTIVKEATLPFDHLPANIAEFLRNQNYDIDGLKKLEWAIYE